MDRTSGDMVLYEKPIDPAGNARSTPIRKAHLGEWQDLRMLVRYEDDGGVWTRTASASAEGVGAPPAAHSFSVDERATVVGFLGAYVSTNAGTVQAVRMDDLVFDVCAR